MKQCMSTPADDAQTKPYRGQLHIFKIPIPGTSYSIRLWPGIAEQYQFCLGFVHTETGEATDSPIDYQL